MTEQPGSGEEKKTIAIRVSPELRGRLDSVLQITGGSVNDAGTEALEQWIAGRLADPTVRAKALEGLEAEERALQARRKALQGLVGGGDTTKDEGGTSTSPRPASRRGKAASE